MAADSLETRWHTLPDGVRLELLFLPAACGAEGGAEGAGGGAGGAAPRPPLLFLHGSFHGAWCWKEHYMPYFAAAGYDCYAVSQRGHGASGGAPGGSLQQRADDLASVVAGLPAPPLLVVHSFGGRVAAKYVSLFEEEAEARASAAEGAAAAAAGQDAFPERPALAGLALLAAAPPTGFGRMMLRKLWSSPLLMLRTMWTFGRGTFRTSPSACRLIFFSEQLAEEELQRYQACIAAGPTYPPASSRRGDPATADAVAPAPPPGGWRALRPAAGAAAAPQVFAGCCAADVLLDRVAAEEGAAYFGGPGDAPTVVLWEGLAHDCMLDAGWRASADSLQQWLDTRRRPVR